MKYLILFLLLVGDCFASDCFLEGRVQLQMFSDDFITGSVGKDEIQLAQYTNYIYGDVKGYEADLTMLGGFLRGYIGPYFISWKFDSQIQMFSDYQECLPLI